MLLVWFLIEARYLFATRIFVRELVCYNAGSQAAHKGFAMKTPLRQNVQTTLSQIHPTFNSFFKNNMSAGN